MKIHLLGRTGPRSQKGKSISSMNSVKHGAYAKTEVLPFEDADERKRLDRALIKAFQPKDAIELTLIQNMAQSLWTMERFKNRLALRQGKIFKEIAPRMLAELIGIPTAYQPYAPDYLKEPNIKFAKKDLQEPIKRYNEYLHLRKNSLGIQNYQMVFGGYQALFEGAHQFAQQKNYKPVLNALGNGLDMFYQNDSTAVEELLLQYAASLYYMTRLEEWKPAIRTALASWFFIDRYMQKDADYQDEQITKEMNRYQLYLSQLLKYRRTMQGVSSYAGRLQEQMDRNEISNSDSKSVT
jgi:hypothetical protein